MFSSNKTTELEGYQNVLQNVNLDKLTLWLIRLACIFLIIFFAGLLLAVPILISLLKSQYVNFSIGLKDLIKSFLEVYID